MSLQRVGGRSGCGADDGFSVTLVGDLPHAGGTLSMWMTGCSNSGQTTSLLVSRAVMEVWHMRGFILAFAQPLTATAIARTVHTTGPLPAAVVSLDQDASRAQVPGSFSSSATQA